MGKSKPSTPSSQTVNQTNLPAYAKPYFERLLKRTESESQQPYNQFQGQRISNVSGDTTAAQNMVRAMQSGIQGLPQAQTGTQGALARAQQGQNYQSQDFDSAAAQQYMSPYMQNVVNVQKQQAIQDWEQRTGRTKPTNPMRDKIESNRARADRTSEMIAERQQSGSYTNFR